MSSPVTIEKNGDIALLRLNQGVTNAVGPDMVNALSRALVTVKNESRGVVLAGGEKFFSIGLDLPSLLDLDYGRMQAFWHAFNRLVFDLYTLPMPTVCALGGHAPGAGTVLAMACDFRFAAGEKALIGLNEMQLGIPTPYLVDLMVRRALTEYDADELLFNGGLMRPEQAKAIHLIHETCSRDELEEKCVARIRRMANASSQAFAAVKNVKTENIRSAFQKNHQRQHEIFLKSWFSEPTQELLRDALKNF